jgi:lysophospholipid acyltransferase (LPLAT)-like uncharacterized protein
MPKMRPHREKSNWARVLAGRVLAGYIRFTGWTTRWTLSPEAYEKQLTAHQPLILAMWHGQHVMVPYFRPEGADMCVMISRHGDGEINAVAVQQFGINVVRGSGGHGNAGKTRKRQGAGALMALLRALKAGTTVVLTADVPKVAGRAGLGIITLARLSGRPIVPVAIATRHHYTFHSWDKATLPLPFGRGSLVLGDVLHVPADAGETEQEALRQQVEDNLNSIHARAYAAVGGAKWEPRHG